MDIGGPELIEPAKAELFELQAAAKVTPDVEVVVQTTGLLLEGLSFDEAVEAAAAL